MKGREGTKVLIEAGYMFLANKFEYTGTITMQVFYSFVLGGGIWKAIVQTKTF